MFGSMPPLISLRGRHGGSSVWKWKVSGAGRGTWLCNTRCVQNHKHEWHSINSCWSCSRVRPYLPVYTAIGVYIQLHTLHIQPHLHTFAQMLTDIHCCCALHSVHFVRGHLWQCHCLLHWSAPAESAELHSGSSWPGLRHTHTCTEHDTPRRWGVWLDETGPTSNLQTNWCAIRTKPGQQLIRHHIQ